MKWHLSAIEIWTKNRSVDEGESGEDRPWNSAIQKLTVGNIVKEARAKCLKGLKSMEGISYTYPLRKLNLVKALLYASSFTGNID